MKNPKTDYTAQHGDRNNMSELYLPPPYESVPKLTLNQKIVLAIQGYIFYKYIKRTTDLDYLPVYIVRCPKHGDFLDHPQGYNEYFTCHKCLMERYNK